MKSLLTRAMLFAVLWVAPSMGFSMESGQTQGTAPNGPTTQAQSNPKASPAAESLRAAVTRSGWVNVVVDLYVPDKTRGSESKTIRETQDLTGIREELLGSLAQGSYQSMPGAAGQASLALKVNAAGLEGLLASPRVAAVVSSSASFEAGPLMATPRQGHMSASLEDGRVVVFGGHGNNFVALNSAEIWQSQTNSFASLTMNSPRDGNALAKLTDGRYLLAGGAYDWGVAPGYNTAEIFNPADGTFTPTANLTYARVNCAAATLNSGKVLIVGGWYSQQSPLYGELFDPATGTFTATGPLTYQRSTPIVVPTADGKALVLGGITPYGQSFVGAIELYDPASNQFTVLQDELLGPDDPDWKVFGLLYGPVDSYRLADGRYVFLAYKPGTVWQFALFTVDPSTKKTAKFETSPALPSSDVAWLNPVTVDKTKGKIYSFITRKVSDVRVLSLYTVDVASKTLELATGDYTLPSDYYPENMNLALLKDSRLFMTGGRAQPSTNFSSSNRTLFVTTKFTAIKPDFVLTGLTLNPASPATNGPFKAVVKVKNQGTLSGDAGWLDVWTHQSSRPACGADGNQYKSVGILEPGQIKTLTFTNLKVGTPGNKTFRAFVDSSCQSSELVEINNQRTKAYTAVSGTADLAVTSIVLNPTSPTANETFTATVKVKNHGSSSTNGGWLDVWTHQPNLQGCGADGNQYKSVGSIAPGATVTVTFAGLKVGAKGNKTFRAFVDSACATVESDENNNQSTLGYSAQ